MYSAACVAKDTACSVRVFATAGGTAFAVRATRHVRPAPITGPEDERSTAAINVDREQVPASSLTAQLSPSSSLFFFRSSKKPLPVTAFQYCFTISSSFV